MIERMRAFGLTIASIVCLAALFYACHLAPPHENKIYTIALRASSDRLNLRIELVPHPAIRESVLHMYVNGAVESFPLGENLQQNLPAVARAAFSEATVGTGDEPDRSKIDALLKVKLQSADDSGGEFPSDDRTSTIVLEWKLLDLDGHVVWAETVKGQATRVHGIPLQAERRAQERFRATVADVCKKSYEALSSSSVIREFVNSTRR